MLSENNLFFVFENNLFFIFKNKKHFLIIKHVFYVFYFKEQKTVFKNSFQTSPLNLEYPKCPHQRPLTILPIKIAQNFKQQNIIFYVNAFEQGLFKN